MAGCWVHAKRKFVEYVKVVGTEKLNGAITAEAAKQFSELCHIDSRFAQDIYYLCGLVSTLRDILQNT